MYKVDAAAGAVILHGQVAVYRRREALWPSVNRQSDHHLIPIVTGTICLETTPP